MPTARPIGVRLRNDNVLFENGAGEGSARSCRKPATSTPWPAHRHLLRARREGKRGVLRRQTQRRQGAYQGPVDHDLRANKHFTLKTRPLKRNDRQDFIDCYHPANRQWRKETERFKYFDYKTLVARDKVASRSSD